MVWFCNFVNGLILPKQKKRGAGGVGGREGSDDLYLVHSDVCGVFLLKASELL